MWPRSSPGCSDARHGAPGRTHAAAPPSDGARRCTAGVTLVELLVALTLAGVVGAGALSLALSSRRLFETDLGRTTVNQNLRAGLDLLGIQVRQTGERLPADFPALELVDGDDGGPDTLILRRNLLDAVLPLCVDIAAGSVEDEVVVALDSGTIPPGCDVVADDDGDGWPDNLQAWRAQRLAQGGELAAYLYNPVTQDGEFFAYDDEDAAGLHLHRGDGHAWGHDYRVNELARVYVLEEFSFTLADGILRAAVNRESAARLNLVAGITEFQVRAFRTDGSVVDALAPADRWGAVSAVEVTLRGLAEGRQRDLERSVSTRFFPRNVLSLPPSMRD